MAGPLDGVRVVDLGEAQQGPVATMVLGDLGADIIKVERTTGDRGRGWRRIHGVRLDISSTGRNPYFENHNRNKRSIVLDLKKGKGKEVLLKLVDKADVFTTNMRIGVPDRLGIGYEALRARNPRLIYAHASGWGRKGPDATEGANDYTAISRGGLMMLVGKEGEPPGQIMSGLADELGGMVCAWAICAALYARERTGKGQLVDTSLFGSLIAMESLELTAPALLGTEFPRQVRSETYNPLFNYYKCSDGKWFVVSSPRSDKDWPNICRALGIEELEHDPKFINMEARGENCRELIAILDEKFATKTHKEWIGILRKYRLNYAPVQTPTEVINDPQALANDYVIWFDHPVSGRTKMIGFPWMFSETPASVRREPPELGQHTEEILLELGYTWDDIVQLKDEGVTG